MDFGSIIDFIVQIVEEVINFIVQVANVLFQLLVDVWNGLVTVITDIWNWLGNIWSTLKDFFDDLWWEVIVPFIEWCQEIIDDITTWLQNFFDPIIQFLHTLNNYYQFWYHQLIQPLLEVISRMRVILGLLKLLGVKWAAKLDADLQIIQSWITTVIRDITGTLNAVSTVIGLMVDPTGILRRDFFGNTLFSSVSGIKRSAGYGTDRPSTVTELNQASQNQAMVQGYTPTATLNTDGTISFMPGVSDINANVDAAFQTLGAPKPPD